MGAHLVSIPQQAVLRQDNNEYLIDRFKSYLKYWPHFLLSMCICIFLAYLFVQSAIPIYTVNAKILINHENTARNLTRNSDQVLNPKKADDEIEILRSRTLMEQVVRDLHLWTKYYNRSELHSMDLYLNTPVKFNLKSHLNDPAGRLIEIIIIDDKTYYLKQPHSLSKFFFGEQVKSSFGSWTLTQTENLKDFIGKTISIQLDNPSNAADEYLSSFNAYLYGEQSSIVQLTIKETVPERGADVINSTIKAYNLASIEYKNRVNEGTLGFLDQRLDSISSELNYVEKRVEKYKSSRGITDLPSESQQYLESLKGNDSRLNDVDVQLQIINEIQKYINSPISNGNAPATAGITDPGLISLVEELIKLEAQKDRLLSTTPEKNPIFLPLKRQISTTKNAIRENLKGIKRSFVATKNQLQKYNKRFESSIKKLPGQEREFITIKRRQSIKEELYIFLLQKREEAGMENASKLFNSRIIDKAHFGPPETLNANFTYALALLFGIVLPAGVIFAKDALDNKITSVKEIENSVLVPILGEISYQKSQPDLLIADGTRSMMSEEFRILRTKLSHLNGRSGNGKITLLTSGMPGEGKSMICRNLASVMAAAGRKTVIIDADFRRPQLAKTLKLSDDVGLSNYLNGTAFKEQIIQVSNIHPQLFFITAGSETTNPSELFEKPSVAELFDWLRLYFDEILIDTPPIQLVTDALILTTYSDSNLYVLRQNYSFKSQFKYINQLYNNGALKNLNIVYNSVTEGGNYNNSRKYALDYYPSNKPKFKLSLQRRN